MSEPQSASNSAPANHGLTEAAELSPVKRALQEIRELKARLAQAETKAAAAQSGPIAIVGAGMRFPGGVTDSASLWQLLESGSDAITEIPRDRWDWRQYFDQNSETHGAMNTFRGGFLDNVDSFDANFFGIAQREAAKLDPQQRLLHEVAWHALEDAAITPDLLRHSQTGIFVGMSNFDYYRAVFQDDLEIDAYGGSGNSPAMAAGRLAYTLGVHGPTMTLDTSCSSSLVAVHLASQSLRAGECHTALVGGVNLILGPQMHVAFTRAHMLAPDGHCKTFSQTADGYVRSEGCAVVVLKRLNDALGDGDRVMAILRGSAINHDGRSGGLTAPSSHAQASLLREACARAGVPLDSVGMIEAHGTGTSLGDPIEMEALGNVFGNRPRNLPPIFVGSIKTNLGHTEAVSGLAGLLKVVLSLEHQKVSAHLHCQDKSAFIPWSQLPFELPAATKEWFVEPGRPRIAGVSSFGFSGSNAHVVLEESCPTPRSPSSDEITQSLPQLIVLSARSPQALAAARSALADVLASGAGHALSDISATLAQGRMHHLHRAAWVATSNEDLLDQLRSTSSSAPTEARQFLSTPSSLCFVFTGQGSEHSGMGLSLLERSSVFGAAVERLDKALSGILDRSIAQIWASHDGELEQARYVQPALYAYGWALSELWRSLGVEPQTVLGHSLGEYIAATVAGVITPEEAIGLVAARGRLTEELAQPGGMISVLATQDQVRNLLAQSKAASQLSIAAVNGPSSIVVSGPQPAIDTFAEQLCLNGLGHKRLRTTHGFHSRALDPMLDAFEAEAAKIRYQLPELRWISNVTGSLVDRHQPVDAAYWRQHLRQTVQFAASVATANTNSPDSNEVLFLELGAQPHLLALIEGSSEANAIDSTRLVASIAKSGAEEDWHKLLNAAATLYTRGVDLNWKAISQGRPFQKIQLPGYPFERQRFWFNDHHPPEAATHDQIAAAAEAQSSMVPIALDVARISEREQTINDWAAALIFNTLRDLGCWQDSTQTISTGSLISHQGVSPIHLRLMERWLNRLQERGWVEGLQADGQHAYRIRFQGRPADPGLLWIRLESLLATDQPLRDYLFNCAAMLTRVLRGELEPLETLFPGGSSEIATALYERSPASVYVNQIAAAAIAAKARAGARTAMGFGRRLRILEIGAGTGATAAAVLARLSPEQVLYTYSDVSELFLNRARRRFSSRSVEFTLFDLDREEHALAHEGRYDLVVIANALHAATNLSASLDRVHRILQPGGTLILVETTTAQTWHDISTGLIEGWQHFEDEVRTGSPLISEALWQEQLALCGFEHSAAYPSPDKPTHPLGLHVLIAHRPVRSEPSHTMAPATVSKRNSVAAAPTAAAPASAELTSRLQASPPRQRPLLVIERVRGAVGEILGHNVRPRKEDRLMDLGVDSLMAIELKNRLQNTFALEDLPSTLIFDYPTSEAVAHLLLKKLGYDEGGDPLEDSTAQSLQSSLPAEQFETHNDADLDAMTSDELAELLRFQLEH